MNASAGKSYRSLAEIGGNDHDRFSHHEDYRGRARRLHSLLSGLGLARLAPDELLGGAAEVFVEHCSAPQPVRARWTRYASPTRDRLHGPDEVLVRRSVASNGGGVPRWSRARSSTVRILRGDPAST